MTKSGLFFFEARACLRLEGASILANGPDLCLIEPFRFGSLDLEKYQATRYEKTRMSSYTAAGDENVDSVDGTELILERVNMYNVSKRVC